MFKNKFVILLISIALFLSVFTLSSCVQAKTENMDIIIHGDNMGISIDLGKFEVAQIDYMGNAVRGEVLKSDADKFIEFMNSSEYYIRDFTLYECYNFDREFSDGYHVGDNCKLFYNDDGYWIARQVNVKYFYFQYVPLISPWGESSDGVKFNSEVPILIFDKDSDGRAVGVPYKVLYGWEELKTFFPDGRCDDENKRMYIECSWLKNYHISDGVTYFDYDEETSSITFSEECITDGTLDEVFSNYVNNKGIPA